ncbi:hypothetical protein AVEN_114975-1 [Araneus ventricosus]|uniref:Uncharacterized protein n=1 Tax=Araneus ventricosus TaxID=182803 RepID=A0A4Y2D7Z2_ARAVE|nr:hypothetical protein AVEN_114975-1 [Araneus ventricosus]
MSGINAEEYLIADVDLMVSAGVTEDEMENDDEEDDTDTSQSLSTSIRGGASGGTCSGMLCLLFWENFCTSFTQRGFEKLPGELERTDHTQTTCSSFMESIVKRWSFSLSLQLWDLSWSGTWSHHPSTFPFQRITSYIPTVDTPKPNSFDNLVTLTCFNSAHNFELLFHGIEL